jgi:hypothetical protein
VASCNHCGQCKWILAPKIEPLGFAEISPIHSGSGFDAAWQGHIHIAPRSCSLERLSTRTSSSTSFIPARRAGVRRQLHVIRDMEVLDTLLPCGQVRRGRRGSPRRTGNALNVASAHIIRQAARETV